MLIKPIGSKLILICTGLGIVVLTATSSFAGGNKINLRQESGPNAVTGNTIMIVQGAASNSLVAGSLDGELPASQIGFNNEAKITMTGTGGVVVLNQGSADAFAEGNFAENNNATVNLSNAGMLDDVISQAFLSQQGFDNVGVLSVSDPGAYGSLEQLGNNNEGSVSVNGNGASGTLKQERNNNNFGLTVTGATATYEQVGNNLTGPSPAVVISNGGTVTITQYQMQ